MAYCVRDRSRWPGLYVNLGVPLERSLGRLFLSASFDSTVSALSSDSSGIRGVAIQIVGEADQINLNVGFSHMLDDLIELIVAILVQAVWSQDYCLAPVLSFFSC